MVDGQALGQANALVGWLQDRRGHARRCSALSGRRAQGRKRLGNGDDPIADALDNCTVKHISGGTSTLGFKSYDQGRQKWQGETLDGVWFDEEPPMDIYMEGLTRTNATGGIAMITFTPLLGMSDVVSMFLGETV